MATKKTKPRGKLPKFDLGEDKPSYYSAPVCGYLAKVTVSAEQCKKCKYPFNHGDIVFVFGEIAKMAGHCVLATKDGKTHFCWHTDYFTPLPDEEI